MNGTRRSFPLRSMAVFLFAAALAVAAARPTFADDTDLFRIRARPNVLLILDDSGSMYGLYGGTEVGDLDGQAILYYPQFNQTGWTSTRADVRMRVLYGLLNANNSIPTGCTAAATTAYPTSFSQTSDACFTNNLDVNDETALNMRLGLMRFPGGTSVTSNFYAIMSQTTGTSSNLPPFSPSYQSIWGQIKSLTADYRATPTALALRGARTNYFVTAATGDNAVNCRRKFAILLTDGEDTVGTNPTTTGDGSAAAYYDTAANYGNIAYFNADGWSGSNTGQIARNSSVIQEAKALADNGVILFVVGVGMTGDQDNTDRPHLRALREVMRRTAEQAGDTTIDYAYVGTNGDNTARGGGRIFFADSAEALLSSFQSVFDNIILQAQAFTSPVVPSVRTTDNNKLYACTFIPDNPPETFWEGHVRSYNLADNGAVLSMTSWNWDAGSRLTSAIRNYSSDPRKIYTASVVSGAWTRGDFSTPSFPQGESWIDNNLLGVTSAERNGFIDNVVLRANRTKRLGDIFHSTPVLIGAPNAFYSEDGFSSAVGAGATESFVTHYAHRKRVIYAGGNDGMLHAFEVGNWQATPSPGAYDSGTGNELFGYIPNRILGQLKQMRVTPTSTHPYLVDSAPKAADVWLDANANNVKETSEWKTVLIAGLRKGGRGYYALDVTDPASTGGYPAPLWELTNDNVANLGESWSEPAIGKVKITEGGVTKDRWVAFVGGGYWCPSLTAAIAANAGNMTLTSSAGFPAGSGSVNINLTDPANYSALAGNVFTMATTGSASAKVTLAHVAGECVYGSAIGAGFYVIDIKSGTVLWKYEKSNDSNMQYPLTAAAVAVDTNTDSYMNFVYAVDLANQLWRFDFGTAGTYDNVTRTVATTGAGWSGKRVFAPADVTTVAQRSFNKVEVAFDGALTPWIFFGTGDREKPEGAGTGRIYAIKDLNLNTTYTEADLANFSSVLTNADATAGGTMGGTDKGWYADLPNTDEKSLSDYVVFNNKLYFTTFKSDTSNLCLGGGVARLYGLRLALAGTVTTWGAAGITDPSTGSPARSIQLAGGGIPSNPVVSMSANGGAALYVGTTNSGMNTFTIDAPSAFKRLRKWKEWIAN